MAKQALTPMGQYGYYDGRTPGLAGRVADSSGWPPQQGGAVTAVSPRSPSRVMIIDGSLTVRMVMKTCLKRAGLEVFDFPDGIQALRWLRNTEEALSFDLIFLDLEVPKMDWYLVMQQLKAHPACNDTILVMLSRHDGLLDRLKARLAGAHSYLAKPFRTQELLTIIQHHFPCIDPQGTTHGKER